MQYWAVKKKELRHELKEYRSNFPEEKKSHYDRAIFDNLVRTLTFRHTDSFLAYYSIEGEVYTINIIEAALEQGKRVYLPRCTKSQTGTDIMFFHKVNNLSELVEGMYGIHEPPEKFPLFEPKGHCACIVPGLAFDITGNRIGYGKGYYDRFLRDFCGTKIGLCYSDFLLDSLPVGRYDTKVDMVITEKGIVNLNAKK